jgi:hypothetical protein
MVRCTTRGVLATARNSERQTHLWRAAPSLSRGEEHVSQYVIRILYVSVTNKHDDTSLCMVPTLV